MRSAPALALAAALLATACSSTPDPIQVNGALVVPGGNTEGGLAGGPGQQCVVDGGYSDIRKGAQVVVTNDTGQTIALGQLASGWLRLPDLQTWATRSCVFPFTMQVPGGHPFYNIQVTHRGTVVYSAEQLREPVEMSLGDG